MPVLDRLGTRLLLTVVFSTCLHLALISQFTPGRFGNPARPAALTDIEYCTDPSQYFAATEKPKAKPRPKPKEIVDLSPKPAAPEALNSEQPKPDDSEDQESGTLAFSDTRSKLFLPFYAVEQVPVFTSRIMPAYPESAQKLGRSSKVILEAYIDIEGHVRMARIVKSGGDLFDSAALDALKKSLFKPALINGKPVPVKILIPYVFSLEA